MATFDLGRFRDLAFGRGKLPDHPLQDVDDARAIVAQLAQDEPETSLGELTHWAASMNATDSFTPGRRARVLMTLDVAARPLWRVLARRYLAPNGEPSEKREGDRNILRALFDAASEFANGFAIVLDAGAGEEKSAWVEENRALLYLRNIRWLGRRLVLSHMLHLNSVGAIWERTHRLHQRADERGLARKVLEAFPGDKVLSSVRQEYARMLLFELASPESLRPRHIELVFRIAGRKAAAVRLEAAPADDAPFAVVPQGDARPGPRRNYGPGVQPPPLYIATLQCLPRLRAALERDMGRDPSDRDTLYGDEYTLRERNLILNRLLECWGPDAPRRRARRVALTSAARVVSGFHAVVELLPAPVQSKAAERGAKAADLQLAIDDTTMTLSRKRVRAASQVGPARVVDASNGGIGLAVRGKDAPWARHGALVAIALEPANEWIVGVVRRIFSLEEELRLGVQILARQPRALAISVETFKRDSVWEEAMRFEATYKEQHRKALLLAPQEPPLQGADMLLEPGLAGRGTQFDVPLPRGVQRIRVTQVLDDGEHFQRVLFEPLR